MECQSHLCSSCLNTSVDKFNRRADDIIAYQQKVHAYIENATRILRVFTITEIYHNIIRQGIPSSIAYYQNPRLTKSQPEYSQPMILKYNHQAKEQSRRTSDTIMSKNNQCSVEHTSPSLIALNVTKTTSPLLQAALSIQHDKDEIKWSMEHPQLNMLKKQKTLFSSSGEINKNWPEGVAQKLLPPSTFSPLEEDDLNEQ